MNELNKLRDQAYENSLIYKEKTKKIHGSKIKNRVFNVGDRVLLSILILMISRGKTQIPIGLDRLPLLKVLPLWNTIEYLKHVGQISRVESDCPDFEDSRARGFVHRSLNLQSFACLYMGIRYPRSY
ncbi:hypothetical protein Tco_0356201 [Tanacetum coccineum]